MKEKEFIDMDIFSRRIGPYFTWLESKIESGWVQSDSVSKDVLKETKGLATAMRARFILGITREDFKREIETTLELFDLALDAFPDYSGDIEGKLTHFTKGLKTEFGDDIFPNGSAVEQVHPEMMAKKKIVKKKPAQRKTKKLEVKTEVLEPVKAEVQGEPEPKVKKAPVKVKPPKVQKEEIKKEPEKIEEEPEPERLVKKESKFVRWLKNIIYGED